MCRIRRVFILELLLLLLFTNPFLVSASETDEIPILYEIELPDDLNFTVNNVCSEHLYFNQAAANEIGEFVVFSRYNKPEDLSDVTFSRAYIDIYGSDGIFLKELSFATPFDFAVEIDESTIKAWFYSTVLIYDFESEEVSYYQIPEGSAMNGGLYKQLRRDVFVVGNWTYSYKDGFGGHIELSRSDGTQTQVLIESPKTDTFVTKVAIPGIFAGVVIIAISVWISVRKRKK